MKPTLWERDTLQREQADNRSLRAAIFQLRQRAHTQLWDDGDLGLYMDARKILKWCDDTLKGER